MKGLILSGGKGTRLLPLTYRRAKQLIPVANEPVLWRVSRAIRDAGIDEIGIVVGDTEPEIREAVNDGERWGVKITYIRQSAPAGLAHAVKESLPFLGDDRFVMFLGDNVIEGGISPLIRQFAESAWNSQIVLKRVPNPQQFGVAVLNGDGHIKQLVEKPKEPPSDLALVGIYMFDQHVAEAVNSIRPSARGEYEITDAIQGLIDRKRKVSAKFVAGWWKDTGAPADLLEANRLVLDQTHRRVDGDVAGSEITGNVVVEPGARVAGSKVTGPVHIAAGAVIENAVIGPYTSIGPHCVLSGAQIENSILLHEARLEGITCCIVDSVLGQGVRVSGSDHFKESGRMQLVLGDYSQVKL
jgi:glucose-1-phosphate thymidylyltransferase